MQWDTSKYAGFSTSKPWQKENESYLEINAESQVGVKDSVFEHWASLLRLRKTQKDIFIYGNFELLDVEEDDVFAYTRTFGEQKVIVVANFRKTPLTWSLPSGTTLQKDVLISNYSEISIKDGSISLRPFEAFACFVN
jgi:glycosidase